MKKNKKEKRFRKSYRRKIIKPFYKKKFFIYFIIFFLSTIAIFYFLVFFDFFAIKKIEIKGNEKIKSEELIDFIERKTKKSLLFLESKSIFFFIPSRVAPEIVKEFPEIAEFELKRKYPDTIKLELKERYSIGTWCQEKCFFFDKTGKIFKEADFEKGLIVKTENRTFSLGERVFSSKEIESILIIRKELESDIKIKEFHISGTRIDVLTKENWIISFTLEDDIKFQTTKLYLTLKEKILPEERKNLDYVDLRFNKRIYYKYKNIESINIINEN